MKQLNIVIVLVFLFSMNLKAQENKSLKSGGTQISFAYPIGSNGANSPEYLNNFSFNVLYGFNGGVNGAEIGSILNHNAEGINGFQLSGVMNINKGYSKGLMISGISTIIKDSTSGFLISGVLNYSEKAAKGVQLSTLNIASNEFNGFQLGVFNYAKKLKGVQFGVINVLEDGESGVPIGLFSFVKNGHYEFELTGGEVIYTNLNFKMGVERFYTIFKLGFSSYKNDPIYSLGMGFGSNVLISEKHKVSVDLSFNQIFYDDDWESEKLNFLNKADLNYKYHLSPNLSLLLGPSFNLFLAEERDEMEYGTLDIPYTLHTYNWDNNKLFMWIGVNAGIAVKL